MSMKNEAEDYQDDMVGLNVSTRLCWEQLEELSRGTVPIMKIKMEIEDQLKRRCS